MIKFFLPLFLVSFSWTLAAQVALKTGDILLQPLHCSLCNLIEAEEETIYSHIGVVLKVHPEVMVGEAFGSVKALPLEEFQRKTQKGQSLRLLRVKDERVLRELVERQEEFLAVFKEEFAGRKYDSQFRWDNRDEVGREKFYCSELVAKLYQAFYPATMMPLKKMHFEKNRSLWEKHFKGDVPDGEWGNSPGDFEKSSLFEDLGDI